MNTDLVSHMAEQRHGTLAFLYNAFSAALGAWGGCVLCVLFAPRRRAGGGRWLQARCVSVRVSHKPKKSRAALLPVVDANRCVARPLQKKKRAQERLAGAWRENKSVFRLPGDLPPQRADANLCVCCCVDKIKAKKTTRRCMVGKGKKQKK